MEGARDMALAMAAKGEAFILNQFANPDNPAAHYKSTAPEIWRDTDGGITHFVSSMGTTGTIMGCSQFFKEKNPAVQIVGVQPAEGAQIPGIRKWADEYLPKFFRHEKVDRIIEVGQAEAEDTMRRMTREEGIFLRRFFRRRNVGGHATGRGSPRRRYRFYRLRSRRSLFVFRGFRLSPPVLCL